MTRNAIAWIPLVFLSAGLPGCGFLLDFFGPTTTSVRLVNNADFDVQVVLYYDEQQEIPRELLTELGTRMDFTIPPGEVASFSRDCDALQAIVIDDADLVVIGSIGPEANTDVLRDGSDFDCGNTITFTFDHGPLIADFDIAIAVE